MGDVAKTLGVGPAVEFEGGSYRINPLTYEQIAEFEVWLETRAFQAVERQKARCDPAEYAARIAAVGREVAACVYSWDGDVAFRALRSSRGFQKALHLTLAARDRPEVDQDFIRRLYEAKGEEVVARFYEVNFPKAQAVTGSPTPSPDESGSRTSQESSSTSTG